MTSPNVVASGNINPSRFVTPSGEFTVAQSVQGDEPIGISSEAAHDAPLPGASTLAASAGQHIKVYGQGEICLLTAGAGGWTAGQFLVPDAQGQGIPVDVTAVRAIGARALTNANAGESCRVQVELHPGQ